MPRHAPAYPAVSGLWGKPTIIDNVRDAGHTNRRSSPTARKWYAAYGTATSRGTKTFSLVGKVERSGLVEVRSGRPPEMVYDIGGAP